jgi:hypothetical protein
LKSDKLLACTVLTLDFKLTTIHEKESLLDALRLTPRWIESVKSVL